MTATSGTPHGPGALTLEEVWEAIHTFYHRASSRADNSDIGRMRSVLEAERAKWSRFLASADRENESLRRAVDRLARERDAACEEAARLRQRHEIALREIAAAHNRLRDLRHPGMADCCCEWCDDHRAARPATEVDRA